MGVERRTTAHRVFEDGHRALISAEVSELTRIFADDYVQYDESGKASTKQDVIDNLGSGKTRLVSMTSTGRHIRRLREDVVIVTDRDRMSPSSRASASLCAASFWTWW
jgi:Domain of unknown function (DUF4440)